MRVERLLVRDASRIAPLLPSLCAGYDTLTHELVFQRSRDQLVTADRRMDVIDEPIASRDALLAPRLDQRVHVDDRHAERGSRLDDRSAHLVENAERAHVELLGATIRFACAGRVAYHFAAPAQIEPQRRVLRIDRDRAFDERHCFPTPVVPIPRDHPGRRGTQLVDARDVLLGEAAPVLRLEGRAVAQVADRVDENHLDVLGGGAFDDASKVEAKVLDNTAPTFLVAMVRFEPAAVIEQRVHLLRQDGARLIDRLRGRPRQPQPTGAQEREEARTGQQPVRRSHRFRQVLHVRVGPILEEFVVPRVDHDEVGRVAQHLLENRQEAVARIRHTAAVDDFPAPIGRGGPQTDLQPRRERRLDRERTPLHRRPAETEDAELVVRLPRAERIRAKPAGPGR